MYMQQYSHPPHKDNTQITCPKQEIMVTCPKEEIMVTCPKEHRMVICPKEDRMVSCPKEERRGRWSTTERKLYHWFLEIHYEQFLRMGMRRSDKVFKSMEAFIGTRTAEQCRSHHQKKEKKNKEFPQLLASLRSEHYDSLETARVQHDMSVAGLHAEHLPSMTELMIIEALNTVHHKPKAEERRKERTPQIGVKKEPTDCIVDTFNCNMWLTHPNLYYPFKGSPYWP